MHRIIRKAKRIINTLVYKVRAKKLHIKFKKGVVIGKNIQRWANTTIVLGENARIASGCVLWGGGTIKIGNNTSIGENSWICATPQGGVTFGDNVNCAANLYVIDTNHSYADKNVLINKQPLVSKPILIGNNIWISANVTIIKGAIINDGCVVGACSLVNKEFSKDLVIAGVPAKVIKRR